MNLLARARVHGKEYMQSKLYPNYGVWQGEAWRSDSGFVHSKSTRVMDVVHYETVELGNDIGLDWEVFARTSQLPASRCMWVARTKRLAAHYGEPELLDISGYQILGSDGEGGYLVVKEIQS